MNQMPYCDLNHVLGRVNPSLACVLCRKYPNFTFRQLFALFLPSLRTSGHEGNPPLEVSCPAQEILVMQVSAQVNTRIYRRQVQRPCSWCGLAPDAFPLFQRARPKWQQRSDDGKLGTALPAPLASADLRRGACWGY